MKVDFIIIGAMKCGTSTLAEMLRGHRQVSFSQPKEPHFFNRTPDWRAHLAEYERCFEPREGVLYGEATPGYTVYPHGKLSVAEDIHAYNPEMKLIYLVRHPVKRAISQYMHMYERGFTDWPLERALFDHGKMLNLSRYHLQLSQYLQHFPPEQLLVLEFEKLVQHPDAVAAEVADFLGLDPQGFSQPEAVYANPSVGGFKLHHRFDWARPVLLFIRDRFPQGQWVKFRTFLNRFRKRNFKEKPTLSPALQRAYLEMLESDIVALESLLNRTFPHWREQI